MIELMLQLSSLTRDPLPVTSEGTTTSTLIFNIRADLEFFLHVQKTKQK